MVHGRHADVSWSPCCSLDVDVGSKFVHVGTHGGEPGQQSQLI